MNVTEFLRQELHSLIRIESEAHFGQDSTEKLLEWVKSELLSSEEDIDDLEDFLGRAQGNPDLNELPVTSFILKILRDYDDYSITEESHAAVLNMLEQHPRNSLLHLLRILTQMEIFEAQEAFDIDRIGFLEDLFRNYGHLVELDDFFAVIDPLLELFSEAAMMRFPDKFRGMLEYAVGTYPEKHAMKYFLAVLYYNQGQYRDAIDLYGSLLDAANAALDRDAFFHIDLSHLLFPLDILQQMAMCYDKTGNDDQTLKLVNAVIDDIPVITGPDDEDGFEDITSYLESFCLRMRINIKRGRTKEVFSDWNRIKDSFLDTSYYAGEFPDVFKVVDEK